MGRQSPFTTDQDAHIDSYMDAFDAKVQELDPELRGAMSASLTQWKRDTADAIMLSPLFKDKLVCESDVNLTTWSTVSHGSSVPKVHCQLIETFSAHHS
jgi:hypothetical protein